MEQLTWENVQKRGVIGKPFRVVSMGITVRGNLESLEVVNGAVNEVHFLIRNSERTMNSKTGPWKKCHGNFSVPLSVVPQVGGNVITFSFEGSEFTLSGE